MIHRTLKREVEDALKDFPAVALLGPRQSGKTTLAIEVGKKFDALYLDLESEQDMAKLVQPELYLTDHLDRLVILDEVHRAPGLFPLLRGLVDRSRRAGKRAGQYLLLGSASNAALRRNLKKDFMRHVKTFNPSGNMSSTRARSGTGLPAMSR